MQVELFADRAAEAGLTFVHFSGAAGEYDLPEMMGPGAALFDYDNDGDLDVYLVQGQALRDGAPHPSSPLGDRLFRNDLDAAGELRFVDVTESSGLGGGREGYGMGVATGDVDNDGWTDLYVTCFGSNQLFRNHGDGTFTDITEESGADDPRWSLSAAFLDYDRDGWLDLYIGNFLDFRLNDPQLCRTELGQRDYCGPLNYNPEPDRLLRNRGDGSFEDVSAASGIRGEDANTLGVIPADFDGDGWLDLYVASDSLPNLLWRNRGDGTFVNQALLAGAALNEQGLPEASMGLDAGDVDGDGDEDLFMSHLDQQTNTLYLNDGNGMFSDVTARSGLGVASWEYTGFGTALLDYDGDSRLDLFVVNGAINVIPSQLGTGPGPPLRQANQLFRNLGGGRFVEVTEQAGSAFQRLDTSRGASVGDVDNDGDPDILVLNNHGRAELLINQAEARGWVGLRLLGGPGPRDMLGAWVGVRPGDGERVWRRVRTAGSYAAANDPRVLFGLGDGGGEVVTVTVRWPDGGVEEWLEVAVGAYQTLLQGSGTAAGEG